MGYYGLGPGMRVPDQLTPLERALRDVPLDCYELTLGTLEKLLKNVAQNPSEPKFRRINLENAKIKTSITSVPTALDALLELGFRYETDNEGGCFLVLPADVKLSFPAHVVKVQEAKDVLKKENEKDRVARGLCRVAPVRQRGEMVVDKRCEADVAGASERSLQRLRQGS